MTSRSKKIIAGASTDSATGRNASVARLIEFANFLIVFIVNGYSGRNFQYQIFASTTQNARFWTILTRFSFYGNFFVSKWWNRRIFNTFVKLDGIKIEDSFTVLQWQWVIYFLRLRIERNRLDLQCHRTLDNRCLQQKKCVVIRNVRLKSLVWLYDTSMAALYIQPQWINEFQLMLFVKLQTKRNIIETLLMNQIKLIVIFHHLKRISYDFFLAEPQQSQKYHFFKNFILIPWQFQQKIDKNTSFPMESAF